jgi:hypothetical protein
MHVVEAIASASSSDPTTDGLIAMLVFGIALLMFAAALARDWRGIGTNLGNLAWWFARNGLTALPRRVSRMPPRRFRWLLVAAVSSWGGLFVVVASVVLAR